MKFKNRRTAGQDLAKKLETHAAQPDVVVLGLTRGGLPVANEVAKKLQAPMDVIFVQKLGVPSHEELALGAIAAGDVCVLNRQLVDSLHIPSEEIDQISACEKQELERRENAYRDGAVPAAVADICSNFEEQVDVVICLEIPAHFGSIGAWYEDFLQISDDQLRQILKSTKQARFQEPG